MPLSHEELKNIMNRSNFYPELIQSAKYATYKTLGGFLKGSSQVNEISEDAVGESIAKFLLKLKSGKINGDNSNSTINTEQELTSYILVSVANYLIDRSRRWGTDPKTNKPATRSRLENVGNINHDDFFDLLLADQTEIHTITYEEGILDKLIDNTNLTENESWILNIRRTELVLSSCSGELIDKFDVDNLSMNRCMVKDTVTDANGIKDNFKQKSNCSCGFVEMTFAEIAKKYGGKGDTYQKRYKKAVEKIRSTAVKLIMIE